MFPFRVRLYYRTAGYRMFETCEFCGRPIAADARQCPHCGQNDPLSVMELGDESSEFEFAEPPAEEPMSQFPGVGSCRTQRMPPGEDEAVAPSEVAWETHYQNGMTAVEEEDFAAAIIEFTQALVEAPDGSVAECYANRGYAYFSTDQFQRAIDDCSQALSYDRESAEAYAWRGAAYADLKDWREAIKDYFDAIRYCPDDVLGEYEEILRSYAEQAIPDYHRAIRTDPDQAQLYQDRGVAFSIRGDTRRAAKDFTEAIRRNPRDSVSFGKRGDLQMQAGAHEKAIADYTYAIKLGQRNSENYSRRGRAYLATGQEDLAIADLSQAIKMDRGNFQALFDRARIHTARGNHRQAASDLTDAIKLDSTNRRAYFDRAEAHVALRQYEAAIADFTEVLLLDMDDVATYRRRGAVYLELQQHDDAIADFSEVIALDATNADAYRMLGNVYSSLDDNQRAIAEMTKSIRLDARNATSYESRGDIFAKMGCYEQAIGDYDKMIAVLKEQKKPDAAQVATAYFSRGVARFENQQPTEAIEDLTKAIRFRRRDDMAYLWRGSVYAGLQRWRPAIADFAMAIRLNPLRADEHRDTASNYVDEAIADCTLQIRQDADNAQALLSRGSLYSLRGEAKRAVKDLIAAAKLSPDEGKIYLERGSALAELEMFDKAIADFTKAIRLGENHAWAHMQRAIVWRRSGQYARAIKDLTVAIGSDRKDPELYFERARTHLAMGAAQRALDDFNVAVELEPHEGRFLLYRGEAYLACNKADPAIKDFNAAIAQEPALAEAYRQRADVYVRTGRAALAIDDYDTAIGLDPMLVAAYCGRGLAIARTGKFDRAIIELTKAIGRVAIDRSFAAAYDSRAKVYLNVGRYREAIADHSATFRIKPPGHDLSATLYGRGLACLKCDDRAEAKKSFRAALQRDPKNTNAQAALRWIDGDESVDLPVLKATPRKLAERVPKAAGSAVELSEESQGEFEFQGDASLLPKACWIVQFDGDREFGPLTKDQLNRWASEGRLHGECQLLRVDWDAWHWAADLYPELTYASHQQANRPIPISQAEQAEENVDVVDQAAAENDEDFIPIDESE